MKALKNYKLILSAIVFFLSSACVYSYPPDNAAVLYYRAALLYAPDDKMEKVIADFSKETADLSKDNVDKTREFVNKNRSIINTVLDASEVKNCDWGLDYSQFLGNGSAAAGSMGKLRRLVLADTKILIKDGDYATALNHCMSLYKMACHINNDRVVVSYLVGVAVKSSTNSCVMQIMSDMPQDMQNLSRLKNQLIEIDSIPFSIKPAILGERETILMYITPEKMAELVRLCDGDGNDKSIKERLLSFDAAAVERNKTYGENYYTSVIAAFDMPYVQGYAAMKDLNEKVTKDVNSNPDATLTAITMPAAKELFSLATRVQTHNNAIRTAIELYMIKAKTGKLPEELPAGLPGDMFSGKPFNYEKTSNGFILRCQGKDLTKNEVYQYEFKVK